jgi:hypothetical protein
MTRHRKSKYIRENKEKLEKLRNHFYLGGGKDLC